jgi:hypothetical protein
MAYNVWRFMTEEALNGIKIPSKRTSSRVLNATGFSNTTLEE